MVQRINRQSGRSLPSAAMATYEFLSYPDAAMPNAYVQFLEQSYSSKPFPFLVEDYNPHAQSTPSSPSPDMTAALEHLTGSGVSGLNSPAASFEHADVLMADPYLDYVNEVLMAEEYEDSLPAPEDDPASYDAMIKSLYDIIGHPLSLNSTSGEHFPSILTSSYSSEIHQMDLSVTNCDDDAHNQTISSCGVLTCPDNGGYRDFPAKDRSGSFEQRQDKSEGCTVTSSLGISFEYLKSEADYAGLYIGTLSLSDNASNGAKSSSRKAVKKSSGRATQKIAELRQNDNSVLAGVVDLRELLVTCAQAVALGDVRKANQILQELYHVHGVSPHGNSMQRVASYFCDSLLARMAGTGGHQYRVLSENMPSMVSFFKASRIWYQMVPVLKISHYMANQRILQAAAGSSRLHIVDFGIGYGMQWPCLINALADREGGPPLLVITGIENSLTCKDSMEKVKDCGRRLASYANRYDVQFQFVPLVSEKWEDIDPAALQLQAGEVLVVNSVKRLSEVADECVKSSSPISPRQKLLMYFRSLNPNLLLMADSSLACTASFVARFRETVHFFYNKQDMLDTVCSDDPERLLVEQKFYRRSILNMVACEGSERVERPETFKQWDLRIKRAGFELLPIPSAVLSRAKLYVKQYFHRDFMVLEDAKGWLLLGWKGRTMQAMSAWKPCPVVH